MFAGNDTSGKILRQFGADGWRYHGHVAVVGMGDAEHGIVAPLRNFAICSGVKTKRSQCTDEVLPSAVVRSSYSVGVALMRVAADFEEHGFLDAAQGAAVRGRGASASSISSIRVAISSSPCGISGL